MQYQLNIDIDSAGLSQIYAAGQQVTIVKSVVSTPLPTGNLPIAWVSFQPLQMNTVSWFESYDMYASTTALQAGATIKMTSITDVPIQLGWTYTFAQGSFTGATGGGPTTFNVANSQGGMFNFGLSQQAVVNGATVSAPLNAIPILNGEQGTFTPEETVSVFLSNSANNGVVLSQIYSTALTVQLSSQLPAANIGFLDSNNTFVLNGTGGLSTAQAKRFGASSARR